MVITKIPDPLEGLFDNFKGFFTKPSFESFKTIVSAIIVCIDPKTICNLHKTLADNGVNKKGRSTYNWFFNKAKWDEEEIAQHKANLFFETCNLKEGNHIFLSIDSTTSEKNGKKTDGVGKYYDSKHGWIWGNDFVTSSIQHDDVFIPHIAKLYLKDQQAEAKGVEFKTKIDFAIDIINSFKIPKGVKVTVLHDSWFFSKEVIGAGQNRGFNLICQLKSDKKIVLTNGSCLGVAEYASLLTRADFQQTTIKVRGRKKRYYFTEQIVELSDIGSVKLVISKTNLKKKKPPKFFISIDIQLSAKEILKFYENRWNIETSHREANQHLGFKEYQMRNKKAIERFIQLVFLSWTLLLVAKIKMRKNAVFKKN